MNRQIVLICGSRHWGDVAAVQRRVERLDPDAIVIVGGARGVDTLAEGFAKRSGRHVAAVNALWDAKGRTAGFRRNEAMLDLRPDLVIAFHADGSPGTAHTIREARKRGIPVEVHEHHAGANAA